jgi:hypothetical protein
MKSAKVSQVLAVIVPVLCLSSCCWNQNCGTVYVSHPQVFTRERLVIAREKELQFLNSCLSNQVPFTMQGGIDTRSLSAFENSLALTLSPTKTPATDSNVAPADVTDLSKVQLAAPTPQMASNIGISSVDHFNDQMAYRDAVNAVIREKELDDTHDRSGKALYMLKFDTSLFPAADTTMPAFVSLRIQPPPKPTKQECDELFAGWLNRLNARLADDLYDIETRVARLQLGPADAKLVDSYFGAGFSEFSAQVQAAPKLSQTQRTNLISEMESAMEKTLKLFWERPEIRRAKLMESFSNPMERTFLLVGMQTALNAKYEKEFASLVSLQYEFVPIGATNTAVTGRLVGYEPKLDPKAHWKSFVKANSETGSALFAKLLGALDTNCYIDSIDPQVYAQNISDVSSKMKLIDMAFTLSAALGKAGSLADNMRSLTQSQTLLQAIKRQALSVSFADNNSFGWYLGPPFAIKDGKAQFIQAPARESFSVSVVVPVWMRKLALRGRVSWLDAAGNQMHSKPLSPEEIDLPSDLDPLTTAIQEALLSEEPKPTIYSGELVVQAGSKDEQSLLILGQDLWRNPQVFVGSTKADSVDLLPDMNGLLAHFKSIPTNYSSNADLTVVTSFGSASLDGAVSILSPAKPAPAPAPSAKLSGTFAVDAVTPLTFNLDPNTMPSGYAGFSLKLGAPGASASWTSIDASPDGAVLAVTIKPDSLPAGPVVYAVDLGLRLKPGDPPASLLSASGAAQHTFVFFPVKDQEKPRLALPSPPTITSTTNGPDAHNIVLKPVDPVKAADLYKAYPGLQQSVTNGHAMLSLKAPADNNPKSFPLKEVDDGWLMTVPDKADELPAATYDTISLRYETSAGDAATIAVLGGPLKVQKQ